MSGLQIVSDGTNEGTKVLLDGRPVRGVKGVRWEISPATRTARVTLELKDVKIDAGAPIDPSVVEQLEHLAEQIP